MRKARLLYLTAALLPLATAAWGAGVNDPITMKDAITGNMDIKFNTRTKLDDSGNLPENAPALGAHDVYGVDLTILGVDYLKGTVERQPWIPTKKLGRTAQDGYLHYNLKWSIKDPKNPDKPIPIGGWIGSIVLDGNGVYHLDEPAEDQGPLRNAIDSVGKIEGFTDAFSGKIQGKVPEQAGLWGMVDRATKKATKTYIRWSGGKPTKQVVNGADPMGFSNAKLAQGPIKAYPAADLQGDMDYDSESGNYYLDFYATYGGTKSINDHYTGTIKWVENPDRDTTGLGHYEFNIRLNEQPGSEADATVAADDETAFYAVDNTVPGFTGIVSYVDTCIRGCKNGQVVGSKITYHVDANSASKVQTMNLAKVLSLMIGPLNDE